ncbi:lipid-A-disaccharide synthase [Paludibacter propionicigenes WB4]|uniref:Lipid-A-disaccharide synthase n=1 Tax=Paludibacter propionicigenes (strain DSM 17365 / JCM 13257 / WB4) TaxID=694427 RepID=E4T8P8_PALPW|nr:lipid-A-disaccharide synthase [Paludibacter propionicigenes]ADQ81157.1 lipid-A-disaccharide synthase [Paludibacter propionicigenes WB4]
MRYFIIAGEASGDLHASNLMRELFKEDPEAKFCFLGGDLMLAQAHGGKMVKHYRDMAFMGIIAVLRNAKTVLKNLSDCKQAIVDFQPDVLILVDYPSFNLRMARFVKEHLSAKVYFYISPKIWAWKEYRIKEIKRYVDKMFTIFPFETAFYRKHDYQVEYVGNPTIDSVYTRPNQQQTFTEFCIENQLPDKPIIAILAGSRKQEIVGCLPRMVDAGLRFPDYQVVIAGAPGIEADLYNSVLKGRNVSVVFGKTYELLQQSKAAVVNSGTATLETALVGTPEVVVYHVPMGRIGYFVKEVVVRVKFVSLVNIVAERLIVKELLAHLFTVNNIASELDLILNNSTYRQTMLQNYSIIKEALGEPGTAERAAKKMVSSLLLQENN